MNAEDRELFDMMHRAKEQRTTDQEDEEVFALVRTKDAIRKRDRKPEKTVMVDVFGHTRLLKESTYRRYIKRLQDIVHTIPVAMVAGGAVGMMFHMSYFWVPVILVGLITARVPGEVMA